MTLGEIFIAAFVFILFGLGIFFGIKLFRWNQRDMREKAERNAMIREQNNLEE